MWLSLVCLPSIREALGLMELGMVDRPVSQHVRSAGRRSEVQSHSQPLSHSQLHKEFQRSLDYLRSCFNDQKLKQKIHQQTASIL